MDKLVEELERIFEVEGLNLNQKFVDLEEWDSLSVLSIVALMDSDYGLTMNKAELEAFSSISAFVEYVEKNAK